MKTTGPEFVLERNGSKSRAIQNDPTYAAMMENLDMNVGRVLEKLEQLGLENTIVIFTSDNGGLSTLKRIGPTSCRPLRAGKGWTYEGGIRIPTLISWPGKIQPGVNSTPAITMDFYPTLLELAGFPLRPDQHRDGHSLVSTLEGKPDDKLKDRFLAWTYPHNHGSGHTPSNAIRSGDWKLVHRTDDKTPNDQRYELYNLADDIGETNNLSIKHFEKTLELAKTLSQWLEKTTPASESKK
jgi:arylsulfatase A-like enzyme